jgi:hypothetical protein
MLVSKNEGDFTGSAQCKQDAKAKFDKKIELMKSTISAARDS